MSPLLSELGRARASERLAHVGHHGIVDADSPESPRREEREDERERGGLAFGPGTGGAHLAPPTRRQRGQVAA
jgi:hypothetical protein